MYSSLLNSIGLNTTDEKFYSLLLAHGPFERRLYQRCVKAKISSSSNELLAYFEHLKALQEYASGNNFKVERIFPTGPVCIEKEKDLQTVSLILPFNKVDTHTPEPVNRRIQLEVSTPKQFASLRYRGELTKEILEDKKNQLMKWIQYKDLRPVGDIRVLINAPDAFIDYFKTFDVQIEVK